MPRSRQLTVAMLVARIGYAAVLIVAPARWTERWLGPHVQQAPTQVALRALGVREGVLHVGALAAALRGRPVRPWLVASMVGDLSDIAATARGRDGLPDGAVTATAVVAGGSALLTAAAAVADDHGA
ncbi:MAG: hypothetical protein JHC84_13465 [Solirubrobacteraceae bacterium]|nr:hypothetical protein [Solirubrobacteraceae bacterium]